MSDRKLGAVSRVLADGRKYLSDEDNWCQHRSRVTVGSWFNKHERFCATGYLVYKTKDPLQARAMNFLCLASHDLYQRSVVRVNDELGHAAVLKIYDRAVGLALSGGV